MYCIIGPGDLICAKLPRNSVALAERVAQAYAVLMQTAPQPVFEDVLAAAARIAPHAHATPVLRSRGIDAIAGCSLHFKAEPLQRAGAFKFRGACNAVWSQIGRAHV